MTGNSAGLVGTGEGALIGFEPWTGYLGTQLARHDSGAYTYTTDHVALDADGSLFAYHPDNIGRDDLRFASWPTGDEDWRRMGRPAATFCP
jgi:hypothetical protein